MPSSTNNKDTDNEILLRRREIGQERREKTRTRLLTAAARVLAEHGEQKARIEDFVKEAGVARGTFYNYYGTVNELLDDLWSYIGHDPFRAIQEVCDPLESPAERFTIMTRLVLQLAGSNPTWGWVTFYLSSSNAAVNSDLLAYPGPDLRAGMEKGEFDFDNFDSAIDFCVGSIRSALGALLYDKREEGYESSICRLLLRGLGVTEEDTKKLMALPLPKIPND